MELSDIIKNDLENSGLVPEDIFAAPLDDASMRACKLSTNLGYIIPYFSLTQVPLGFYRVKMFAEGPKYRQVKGTPSHVYFPPTFMETFKKTGKKYLIITEGEKKAVAACKNGFPTVAFGGVDSWRSKILVLPVDTEIYQHEGTMHAKLPGDTHNTGNLALAPHAVGFKDLLELILETQTTVLICYDNDYADSPNGVKFQVQRAAADLAFEFRQLGVEFTKIRQLFIPTLENYTKLGLDEYLLATSAAQFQTLVSECLALPNAFPIHPDIAQVVQQILTKPKLPRQMMRKVALMLVADLDARGRRMRCGDTEGLYYFDRHTCRLIDAELSGSPERMHMTPFAQFLYKTYNIAVSVDNSLVNWLSTVFYGEDPIENVIPQRIIAPLTKDVCNFQFSDSHYVEVTSSTITLRQNGEKGNMFVCGQVENSDSELFIKACNELISQPMECWWGEVFKNVRAKDSTYATKLHTLLYYISPWLLRWRGMQLPLEIVTGEAGSGKSTLCELRLNIISGKPMLRNSPNDLRDWQASVANSGGLHITDNIQFTDKQLRQRLSDELCRIVTDPNPSIESRKLYSNADTYNIKVNCVFGFTGISNPFTANDIMQRAFILELDKSVAVGDDFKIHYDGNWKSIMLTKFGGRERWLAHHAVVLQRFFALCDEKWDPYYKASNRLIHLEQTLILMAQVLGMEYSWIPEYIAGSGTIATIDNDWTMSGLKLLTDQMRTYMDAIRLGKESEIPDYIRKLPQLLGAPPKMVADGHLTSAHIAMWASLHDDYADCTVLTRPRSLGRYLTQNKAMLISACKLRETNSLMANKKIYKVYY